MSCRIIAGLFRDRVTSTVTGLIVGHRRTVCEFRLHRLRPFKESRSESSVLCLSCEGPDQRGIKLRRDRGFVVTEYFGVVHPCICRGNDFSGAE